MQNLFDIYCWNIKNNINRTQYWQFMIAMLCFGIIVQLAQIIFNLGGIADTIFIVGNLIFLWPSFILVIKRCNDIGCNIYISIVLATIMTLIPIEMFKILVIGFVLIGIIPSNFIHKKL